MKSVRKPNTRKGFTLVETTLVLAISALMLMGFMAGIAGRIGAQRYSDATNDFADFLRRVYTETINVEITRSGTLAKEQEDYCTISGQAAKAAGTYGQKNPTTDGYPGRTGCAVYGKLVSFGEDPTGDTIYVYDVIGRAIDIHHPLTASETKDELKAVYADSLVYAKNNNGTCSLKPAGNVEQFKPQWSTIIQNTNKNDRLYQGAVLIVRSPISGSIRTFVMDSGVMKIQEAIAANQNGSCSEVVAASVATDANSRNASVTKLLSDNKFDFKDANFCIGSEQLFSSIGRRNNIRILSDGRNVDSVLFVETDLSTGGGNKC